MQQSEMEILLTTLGATAEVMGTQLQPAALMLMAEDLSEFPLTDALTAIRRCRRELTGRLTLAAIIERIQSADGMPGADEAWALMSRPESDTVIITEQMGEAMQSARPLLAEDHVAARMAFKDAYTRIVREARDKKIKPKWFVSMGMDKEGRAHCFKRQSVIQHDFNRHDGERMYLFSVFHDAASNIRFICNSIPKTARKAALRLKR